MNLSSSDKKDRSRAGMQGLEVAFAARHNFSSNRASAIFPIRLRDGTDFHLLFLNYWTLKNRIPIEKLSANLRIYNNSGIPILQYQILKFENHNQISIRRIFTEKFGDQCNLIFDGSAHLEILSLLDIRFNFPAVVGLYQAGDVFSAVHAAGRIKNAEEVHSVYFTQETNWTCKFSDGITPFFHFFNGSNLTKNKHIVVVLRDRNGGAKTTKELDIDHIPPFGSEIFLIKEVFPNTTFSKGDFISVLVEHNSVFPRMVVGNLHLHNNLLEVTHSFPIISSKDYCPEGNKLDCQSFLSAYTCAELELSVSIFPTNCVGTFKTIEYTQKFGQEKLNLLIDRNKIERKQKMRGFSFKLLESERFRCVHLLGHHVPSRLNASFIYKVRGVRSNYSTDIASGAKSNVYPPKFRHWGHGYIADDYQSCILVRNNSHRIKNTKFANARIALYAEGFVHETSLELAPECSRSFSIKDLTSGAVNASNLSRKGQFVSWMLETEVENCETFWIAYRSSDGAIFGDHGF